MLRYAIFSALACFSLSAVQAADQPEADRPAGHVQAQWTQDAKGQAGLFLWSKEPLRSVNLWRESDNRWLAPVQIYAERDGLHTFRLPMETAPVPTSHVYVSGILPDGSRFTDRVTFSDEAASVTLDRIETKEQVAALDAAHEARLRAAAQRRQQEPAFRFVSLLNGYRSQRGLQPVTHDAYLENVSRINNARGGGHVYTANCAQNWCMCSWGQTPEQALRQWQNSSGHNALLLNGGITRVGFHIQGNQATMTAR
jgi:uncharacterized protein YkwD